MFGFRKAGGYCLGILVTSHTHFNDTCMVRPQRKSEETYCKQITLFLKYFNFYYMYYILKEEENALFNNAFNIFYLWSYGIGPQK